MNTVEREPSPVFSLDHNSGLWLFSPLLDLLAFVGSFFITAVALAIGWQQGWLEDNFTRSEPGGSEWTWVIAVLLVDVAHVWATAFRVYFDPREFRRRPEVYTLVPIGGLLAGLALYSLGAAVFWRCLAYLAVFHFVRQQYGWVMLYRARRGESGRWSRWFDTAAIYLATLYPLAYWHAHLPRSFHWFLPGDFAAWPGIIADGLGLAFYFVMILYALRMLHAWLQGRWPNPGKDIVVATTAACWYGGIVLFNSDYAFTVTNVFIHGIPYLILIFWYGWLQPSKLAARNPQRTGLLRGVIVFLATVWALAYLEELLWDRFVWHERGWLFGNAWQAESWQWLIVPLLAVPQLSHYLLDGILWRRRDHDWLARP
jgi:hypothetical protein